MEFDKEIHALAEQVLDTCRKKKLLLSTAESCTGGLVIGALTEIAGSSNVIDRGFITYSNSAKSKMLGVSANTISKFGAVSKEVAIAMALGAVQSSDANIAVSITGIAGPGGGSVEKPVGLVYFAVSDNENFEYSEERFHLRSRNAIRIACVNYALKMILNFVNKR